MDYILDIDYALDCTAQKMKFFIWDFFSKRDQIRSFLPVWSHLLKKSLMENFIFCIVLDTYGSFRIAFFCKGDSWQSSNV